MAIVPPIPPIAPAVGKIIPPPIRKHLPWLAVVGIVGAAAIGFGSSGFGTVFQTAPPSGACALATPAFCDTFSAPAGNGAGNRSGDLDSGVWGVSRDTQNDNVSQGLYNNWAVVSEDLCGTITTVNPAAMTRICNQHLVEGMDDNGVAQLWAAYPRQPFDFAGRTGKASFDVSDDTQGTHTAWPVWMITDQPIPAPGNGNIEGNMPAVSNVPRNAIGVSFAGEYDAACNGYQGAANTQPPKTGVDSIWTITNGVATNIPLHQDGCVAEPHGPNDPAGLNHVEIDLSATSISISMSDPGGSGLHQVAHATLTAPLTRGLTWMEDVHYNANKDGHTQAVHTFAWDNFGFDGPVLARDQGIEVPDNQIPGPTSARGLPTYSLGFKITNAGPTTFQFPGAADPTIAAAALLEFNFFPWASTTLSYAVNGHIAHTYAYSGPTFAQQVLALPVPLSELVPGMNRIALGTSDGNALSVANLTLILAGAGAGGGNSTPGPTATPPNSAATATSATLPTAQPTTQTTATPVAQTCTVIATLNGVDTRYTRPMSECSNQ